MKINKILLALVASFGISTANAVIVQQMVLKNGTVLSGYIQQQDGNGTMTFHTDKAIVCVDNYIVNVGDDVMAVKLIAQPIPFRNTGYRAINETNIVCRIVKK